MTDPVTFVTVGSLVATVVTEAIKAGVGATIKDAYDGLKEKIAVWCGSDVEALEQFPINLYHSRRP